MSEREFQEWWAFYERDPWGSQRGDLQAGVVASTLVNLHRDPRQHPAPFTPADFMYFIEKPETVISEAEIERKIEAFMARY